MTREQLEGVEAVLEMKVGEEVAPTEVDPEAAEEEEEEEDRRVQEPRELPEFSNLMQREPEEIRLN